MGELQKLASLIGANDRTLRRAVAAGAVRCSRPGPRRLRVDSGELSYLRARWPLLQDLRQALRTEPNVELAVLYGQAADGVSGEDEVEVMVCLRSSGPAAVGELSQRLSDAAGCPIHVMSLQMLARSPARLLAALSGGRVLVDRGHVWERLQGLRPRLAERAAREQAHARCTRLAPGLVRSGSMPGRAPGLAR